MVVQMIELRHFKYSFNFLRLNVVSSDVSLLPSVTREVVCSEHLVGIIPIFQLFVGKNFVKELLCIFLERPVGPSTPSIENLAPRGIRRRAFRFRISLML